MRLSVLHRIGIVLSIVIPAVHGYSTYNSATYDREVRYPQQDKELHSQCIENWQTNYKLDPDISANDLKQGIGKCNEFLIEKLSDSDFRKQLVLKIVILSLLDIIVLWVVGYLVFKIWQWVARGRESA